VKLVTRLRVGNLEARRLNAATAVARCGEVHPSLP